MARVRRAAPTQAQPQPDSLIAAATRLPGTPTSTSASGRTGSGWQDRAWYFYDTIGEFRYACDWIGAILSRAQLRVMKINADGTKTLVVSGPAYDYMVALFDGPEGQSEMLKQVGIHFSVSGECYLVAFEEDGQDRWYIVAAGEIKKSAGKWKIGSKVLPGDPLVIRMWRPHPRKYGEANSPARAVLPTLGEIEKLTQHVSAQTESRLTSAGILLVASEVNLPSQRTPGQDPGAPTAASTSAETISAMLTTTMQTAIRNRDSAEAMVPIVLTVPGEYVDKISHLTFWSELDKHAIELRSESIRRTALGMDVPPEVVTGMGATNHWAAWQVDESAIKAHAEPALALITSSLSEGYLRPLLTSGVDAMDQAEAATYIIEADTSEMRLRPNRSKEALELWDRGALSDDALRRETGFHGEDPLTEQERQMWLLRKVAAGSATPNQVAWALRRLGLTDAPVDEEPTRESRPDPSLMEHPTQGPPEQASALLAASEVLVFRALERAGNRLRSHRAVSKDAAPAASAYLIAADHTMSADVLLEDAWSCVEQTTAHLFEDSESLTFVLDAYTRRLLSAKTPHSREALASYIRTLSV